ncbi:MAG: hypothetical protein Q8P44_03870 [Dehalococcoidia bacterium]|nr:hypothetical protein [Dehalococcoidia bacterium]
MKDSTKKELPEKIISQRRPCFLCNGTAGWQVFDEVWDIIGIGPVRIGIRVCQGYGMVLQGPVVRGEILKKYYAGFSNYTNPGRSGKPSVEKIRGVARHIAFIKGLGINAGKAF